MKLSCKSTGASGKMTMSLYYGKNVKDCGGTPMAKSEFDFGEYSHEDAKTFLEGGCVKHYKEALYLKLNKAAPASVIPANFCGPATTTTVAATTGEGADASHASPPASMLGPIAVLAAAIGLVAHL